VWHGDVLKPNRFVCAFSAENRKIAVRYAEGAVINLSNFKLLHGSAHCKLLSHEVLNLFHAFSNFALGFAASCPVATGKAMLVFGLSL
jgi:hypothetical protein